MLSRAAVSSEGSTEVDGFTSKMMPSHGCCQEASIPHCVGISVGLFGVFMTWQLASPRVSDPREKKEEGKTIMPFIS